jgi:glycosyltransferase involved in cell wall biosynthesis
MLSSPRPLRIAIVGNHLPRKCGIATFTTDLSDALSAEYQNSGVFVVAVNDPNSSYRYPARVRFELDEGDVASYRAAADYLNSANVDVVCLQHEFGIFGGTAGSYILRLLQNLNMPVVTTLHTVLREPDANQLRVMRQIAALSERLIVMSEHSTRFLQEVFGVPREKIDLIPHGIPDLPFEKSPACNESSPGKLVLLTLGLLSPNKGLENVIQAMPRIVSRHSNAAYIIAGATHPHLHRLEGDRYRLQLEALAADLGVEQNVTFQNRFVSPQEMAALVVSADLYITPYRNEAQAVSGTLAYALGAGKAIISTPYWHAAELLSGGRGVLVPFDDPSAIADAAIHLLDDKTARDAMRQRAYLYSRNMVWKQAAQSYMRAFLRACTVRMQPQPVTMPLPGRERQLVNRSSSRRDYSGAALLVGGE